MMTFLKICLHAVTAGLLVLHASCTPAPVNNDSDSLPESPSRFGKDFIPQNLVVFGDSYSDSCNVWRYLGNDDKNQPFPTCYPLNKGRADKGPAWPEYLRQLQGQVEVKGGPPGGSPIPGSKNQTTVVNMAFSAATCDNHLFPRAIFGKPIPDIGDQIDLIQNGFNGTLQPGFGPHSVVNTVNGDTDVALIWIGTNDLNFFTANVTENGLFNGNATVTDPLRRGSIIDYVDCIFRRFSQLYEFGYRKFVLLEMIPLELTPYYNTDQVIDPQTGVVPFGLPTVIQQNVLSANFMYPYKAQDFERKYAGAQVEIFPAHELFKRFYFSPQEYGFKNVTSACYYCPTVDDGDLWADALHPSARADRILASKLSRFLKGDRGDALLKGQM